MQTRRRRTRVEGGFDAVLEIEGREIPVTTGNLSLNGVLVRAAEDLEGLAGRPCTLRMEFGPDKAVAAEAKMVRISGKEVGLEFTSLDLDSYSVLRNVVRLSADDADEVDREQSDSAFD
jgi:hypothetical protein